MATTSEDVHASTSLSIALGGAGLSEYAAPFTEAGYESLEDLGTKEAEVKAAISALVKRPGAVNRILRLWRKHQPKESKRPEMPKLPAGSKWDLTEPTITIDKVEYAIPNHLQTAKSGQTFEPADWMIVAKRTKLLYGIHLERLLQSSSDDSARAASAALVWKVPANEDHLDTNPTSYVASSLAYTARTSNLVHNRIIGGSVEVGVPLFSVAAHLSRDEKQAREATHKRLFMTGVWRFQQAVLKVRECSAASPAFVEAITQALELADDQQFGALQAVFDRYGHVVPESVVLGGQLYFQSERTTSGRVNEEAEKRSVEVAVNLKSHIGGSASAQGGESAKTQGQEVAESVSFTCVGGDTTLGSNPQQWAATAKDPNSWAIVGRKGMTPITEWLDPDLRARVTAVWRRGNRQSWAGHPAPLGYVTPDMKGQPFTITSVWASQLRPTVALKSTGPREGSYVAGADQNLLADPILHGLGWRLIYAGKTTGGDGRGKPLYWVVPHSTSGDPEYVMAALDHPEYRPRADGKALMPKYHLGFLPASEMTRAAPETSRATWTLTTADPGGYHQGKYSDAFLLQNVSVGQLLGPRLSNTANDVLHPGNAPRAWVAVSGSPRDPIDDRFLWTCTPIAGLAH